MARPKLPEEDRRSEVYQLRLTKAERELLDEAAAASGEPISDLIREAAIARARRILEA